MFFVGRLVSYGSHIYVVYLCKNAYKNMWQIQKKNTVVVNKWSVRPSIVSKVRIETRDENILNYVKRGIFNFRFVF